MLSLDGACCSIQYPDVCVLLIFVACDSQLGGIVLVSVTRPAPSALTRLSDAAGNEIGPNETPPMNANSWRARLPSFYIREPPPALHCPSYPLLSPLLTTGEPCCASPNPARPCPPVFQLPHSLCTTLRLRQVLLNDTIDRHTTKRQSTLHSISHRFFFLPNNNPTLDSDSSSGSDYRIEPNRIALTRWCR